MRPSGFGVLGANLVGQQSQGVDDPREGSVLRYDSGGKQRTTPRVNHIVQNRNPSIGYSTSHKQSNQSRTLSKEACTPLPFSSVMSMPTSLSQCASLADADSSISPSPRRTHASTGRGSVPRQLRDTPTASKERATATASKERATVNGGFAPMDTSVDQNGSNRADDIKAYRSFRRQSAPETKSSRGRHASKNLSDAQKPDDPAEPDLGKWALDSYEVIQAETYVFYLEALLSKRRSSEGLDVRAELPNEVIEHVNSTDKRCIFISNCPRKARKSYAEQLWAQGVRIRGKDDKPSSLETLVEGIVTRGWTCATRLRSLGLSRPFVITSDKALLEDLQAAGITDLTATIRDNGCPIDAYARTLTEANISELYQHGVDSVVIGQDENVSGLMLALASEYLGLRTPRALKAGDPAPCIDDLPLFLCCNARMKRKVRAMETSASCEALGVSICLDQAGHDTDFPSFSFIDAFEKAREQGGYGVNTSTAVLISCKLSPEIMEFANSYNMQAFMLT